MVLVKLRDIAEDAAKLSPFEEHFYPLEKMTTSAWI
jgi:hypothetical protein